ncbi:MAG: HK97-gp10 family putative phage morphogenesis protein [Geminicoccaceae bacterium]
MAQGATVRVRGARQLNRRLTALGSRRKATAAGRKAVRAGGAVAVKAIRARAPRDKNNLARSIAQVVKTQGRRGEITSNIGPRDRVMGDGANPGRYGVLVEFGTQPHTIPGRLTFDGQTYQGVEHPGARPQPFMRPGFTESKDRQIRTMGNKLWADLSKPA